MTAEDLITRKEWEDIVHSVVDLEQDPKEYKRTAKHNGNIYTFTVCSSNKVSVYKQWGHVGGMIDYNYKCEALYDGRCVGGGSVFVTPTENDKGWSDLCDILNRYLKSGGDYTEGTIKQLSLF